MKLLLDFLPVLLFFVTYKIAHGDPAQAAALATQSLGFLTAGGVFTPEQAPIVLATGVVIIATLIQVLVLMALRRRVEPMVWVSLVLVVVMGGATIWFHSDAFIKWKPTLLYWGMGLALLGGRFIWKKNLVQTVMGASMRLPESAWTKLLLSWVGFFAAMGVLNLIVAAQFSTDAWVNFKLFGSLGLTLAFVVGQGLFLARHIQPGSDA
ncbi:septation protein A [Amphibiibacter pelophylacis]|uniref:Septation protein A n=1 Tax=Amphibiibacter pelophylacis TaxID=1799477 RepID=A0ACC6P2X7_9BURK